MANPIPKRAMNAAVIAALLSKKLIGNMIPTSTMPKAKPQMTPSRSLDTASSEITIVRLPKHETLRHAIAPLVEHNSW